MSTTVPMPELGEGIHEAKVLRWRLREGAQIQAGDVLCDVTDGERITEVIAPVGGWVELCMVVEDQVVPVATALCRIGGAQPDSFAAAVTSAVSPVDSIEAPRATFKMQLPPEPPRSEPLHAQVSAVSDVPPPMESQKLHAHVSEGAEEIELSTHHEEKPRARVTAAGEERLAGSDTFDELKPDGNRRGVLSPAVQGLAAEYGVNLDKIIEQGVVDGAVHGVALIEINCDRILEARDVHGAEFASVNGYNLSLTSFFALAVCNSLLEFPALNARIDRKTGKLAGSDRVALRVVRFGGPNAIDAPPIEGAERLTLRELERSAHSDSRPLADATFLLSDCGPTGVLTSSPPLDGSTVAALSVGAPTVGFAMKNGALVDFTKMAATLMWHRGVVPELEALGFLTGLRERIEEWDWVTLAG